MRPQTYNRIKVDPDLMNGDLKDLIRIAGKLDEVEYEASRGGKISAVEFDASEPDVAELCREIPVLVGGKNRIRGRQLFRKPGMTCSSTVVIHTVIGATEITLSLYAGNFGGRKCRVRQCLQT
jgi:hypothetical protein